MYSPPRRFAWYLAMTVLLLFVIKDPAGAARLAVLCGHLLSGAAGALSKLAGRV